MPSSAVTANINALSKKTGTVTLQSGECENFSCTSKVEVQVCSGSFATESVSYSTVLAQVRKGETQCGSSSKPFEVNSVSDTAGLLQGCKNLFRSIGALQYHCSGRYLHMITRTWQIDQPSSRVLSQVEGCREGMRILKSGWPDPKYSHENSVYCYLKMLQHQISDRLSFVLRRYVL